MGNQITFDRPLQQLSNLINDTVECCCSSRGEKEEQTILSSSIKVVKAVTATKYNNFEIHIIDS